MLADVIDRCPGLNKKVKEGNQQHDSISPLLPPYCTRIVTSS